jgi:hypothetical protein
MWLPLLLCMLIVQYYMPADIKTDYGKILSAYLGVLLIGVFVYIRWLFCFGSFKESNFRGDHRTGVCYFSFHAWLPIVFCAFSKGYNFKNPFIYEFN